MKVFHLAIVTLTLALAGMQFAHADPLVVQIRGAGTPLTPDQIPGFQGLPAQLQMDLLASSFCYRSPLFDPSTDLRVGNAYDCLSNIDDATNAPAITLTDLVTFQFWGSGRVYTTSEVTIQPLIVGVGDATHETASKPSENNILFGTGRFRDATGQARLSGIVNLSNFPATIDFDCLFVINFD